MNDTYAGSQGYAMNAQREATKATTAFEATADTFGAAHRLSDRVMALVNRIAGHLPPEVEGKSGPSPVANGMLEDLRENARSAQIAMQRANDALDRLDSHL